MKIVLKNLGYIETNCYIIGADGTDECVIIDPGADEKKVYAGVEEFSQNAKPVAILLTHGHFDHIMAVNEVSAHYGIKVYAPEAEKELLADPELNYSSRIHHPYFVNADFQIKNAEVLELAGLKLKAVSTPGHTAGSMCYYSEADKLMFSGDTVFYASVGRTDLPTGDETALFKSVGRILSEYDGETRLCPGHGQMTTVEFERHYNPMSTES